MVVIEFSDNNFVSVPRKGARLSALSFM